MRMMKPLLAAAAAFAFGAATAGAEAQTLKTVQDRGKLICGVSQGIAGFSIKDDKDAWSGFDVDFCRALAAAIFNDPSKVEFVPLTASRAVRRAQGQEDRRPVAQLDLDARPRERLRPRLRRRHLL